MAVSTRVVSPERRPRRSFARRSRLKAALDGYAASHRAVRELPAQSARWKDTRLRSSKYLDNMKASALFAGQAHTRRVLLRHAAGDPTGSMGGEPELPTRRPCVRRKRRPPAAVDNSRRRCQTRRLHLSKPVWHSDNRGRLLSPGRRSRPAQSKPQTLRVAVGLLPRIL